MACISPWVKVADVFREVSEDKLSGRNSCSFQTVFPEPRTNIGPSRSSRSCLYILRRGSWLARANLKVVEVAAPTCLTRRSEPLREVDELFALCTVMMILVTRGPLNLLYPWPEY